MKNKDWIITVLITAVVTFLMIFTSEGISDYLIKLGFFSAGVLMGAYIYSYSSRVEVKE